MIVVDASALVAIMCAEPGYEELASGIEREPDNERSRKISNISVWEAACAVSRISRISRPAALLAVEEFLKLTKIGRVDADSEITRLAIDAAERYGTGNIAGNPGILNLGDCFSYATARYFSAKLVCKGEDFLRTDIEIA